MYIYFVCDAITSFGVSCYGLWNLGKRPRIDSAWSSMLLTLALMMTSIFSCHNGRVAKHLSAKRLVAPWRLSTCQSAFFGESTYGKWRRLGRLGEYGISENHLSNAYILKPGRHSKCFKLISLHHAYPRPMHTVSPVQGTRVQLAKEVPGIPCRVEQSWGIKNRQKSCIPHHPNHRSYAFITRRWLFLPVL